LAVPFTPTLVILLVVASCVTTIFLRVLISRLARMGTAVSARPIRIGTSGERVECGDEEEGGVEGASSAVPSTKHGLKTDPFPLATPVGPSKGGRFSQLGQTGYLEDGCKDQGEAAAWQQAEE